MELHTLLTRMAEYTHDAILIAEGPTTDTAHIVYVNRAFTGRHNVHPDNLIGTAWRTHLRVFDDTVTLNRIARAVASYSGVKVAAKSAIIFWARP